MYYNCISCNKNIRDLIFNESFLRNLIALVVVVLLVVLVIGVLTYVSRLQYASFTASHPATATLNPVPLSAAAMVIGAGVGGFIDGILLHQILQWHEMLTNILPGDSLEAKSVNMFWDGIFHAFMLFVTFAGIVMLWKLIGKPTIDYSARILFGNMLKGWAVFNIVEGLINHHILKLHNVRENVADPDIWNYGFLAASAVLWIVGSYISKKK